MCQHCTTAVRQRQHVNATRCWAFFSGLISGFVFGILRTPSECIHNCCGCITPTCTSLAKGLVTGCYRSEDGTVQSLHYVTGFHDNRYSTPTEVLPSFFDLCLASKQYCTKSYDIYIYIYIYIVCGPGSSVGIATDYGLDGPGSNPGGDEIFRPSRPALGPTQPSAKWIPGLSRG